MLRIFNIKQGDKFSFTVTFTNLQEDLTTFEMGVKSDYNKQMLIEKSIGDGITKIDTGKYQIDFTPAETRSLTPELYIYDLRMTLGDIVFTPLYGYLNIQDTVFEPDEEE